MLLSGKFCTLIDNEAMFKKKAWTGGYF